MISRRASFRSFIIPLADIDEVSFDGSGSSHGWADEVGSSAFALSTFEIAVAGACTTFTRSEFIGVHCKAHAAPRFTPIESSFLENAIEPFFLCLLFT